MRLLVGVLLLAAQATMMVHARFHPARYYCWAPYDSQNEYRISVLIDDRELSPAEIRRRYRIAARGLDPRAIQHVFDIVSQYEGTYGMGDGAQAAVEYRTNGSAIDVWRWPRR